MIDFSDADDQWEIGLQRSRINALEALMILKRLRPDEESLRGLSDEARRRICARFVEEALRRLEWRITRDE